MKRFHCGILLTVAFVGSLGVQAQQATEEQMNKALEILRQTSPKPPPAVSTVPSAAEQPKKLPQPAAQAPKSSGKMTAEQETKALEILRGIQGARSAPSQLPTEEAIQQALDEANRISKQRKAGAAPVSQETLVEELSIVESEIMKAKQDNGEQSATPPRGLDAANNPPAASAPSTSESPAVSTMTADQERKALDLLHEVSRDIKHQPADGVTTPKAAVPEARSAPSGVAGEARGQSTDKPSSQTSAAPGSLSSKEETLAELLRAYLNEEISAAQYHKERSRILAKP